MPPLDAYTSDALRAELERREEAKRSPAKPRRVALTDFAPVIKLCVGYIDGTETGHLNKDDMQTYIFEAAMEACFGKDVWVWINAQDRKPCTHF
jgi:hypothetical protein